ncbi:VOC family protein [Rhodococcus olei]|uniref:VOC family protein n=1 Tax=Rhodococcus olei TaxID=2161675 RepID=A0ABP8NUL6_9NOCA
MTPRLDLIGLVSADLTRTFDFYRRLGLDLPAEAAGQPHVEVALPGGLRLALDTVDTIRSFDPDYVHDTSGGGPSLAFDCGTPDGVDETYAELLTVGGTSTLAPFDAFWGQRYATVADPDGNNVDLFAALPG